MGGKIVACKAGPLRISWQCAGCLDASRALPPGPPVEHFHPALRGLSPCWHARSVIYPLIMTLQSPVAYMLLQLSLLCSIVFQLLLHAMSKYAASQPSPHVMSMCSCHARLWEDNLVRGGDGKEPWQALHGPQHHGSYYPDEGLAALFCVTLAIQGMTGPDQFILQLGRVIRDPGIAKALALIRCFTYLNKFNVHEKCDN